MAEPRRSRPARVADAIKEWVVAEGWGPGHRLPGEADLMARFGMSKGTIREAMRLLEAQGLVKSRTGPGGGSFVHEVSPGRAKALLGNYFYFKNLTIGDIYQLRVALEPELAASLAGRLDGEVLTALEETVASYSTLAESPEEERAQHVASLRFHAILAEQAKNPLLGFVIDFMVRLLTDVTVHRELYLPPNPELWSRGRDYQSQLIVALREGNGDAARQTMRAHMETAWRLMRGQEAQMMRRFLTE